MGLDQFPFASFVWQNFDIYIILALRPYALLHIKFLIGNGRLTHFWTDPWLSGGRLKDQYGERAIYDLGMGDDLGVSWFIQNDGWHFPITTSNALMDIFQKVPRELVPWSMFNDEIVCILEDHG